MMRDPHKGGLNGGFNYKRPSSRGSGWGLMMRDPHYEDLNGF